MRAEILQEVAYIKMSTDIKPNFSALAATLKASRNTIKRYYNMKEGDNPKKKRTYKSVFNPYEDFIRERAQNVAGCTYAALFYLKRIDERYLVYRKRLVFGIVPSFAFVIDERGKRELSVKFRKKGSQRERVLVLLVFHGGLYAHRKENEDTNRQVIGFVSLPMNPIFCLFQGKKIIPLKAPWPATMCKPVFLPEIP